MHRYLVFSIVSLALLLSSISSSSASVAFPVIMSDLNTSLVMAGWVLTIYQLVATIVMPLAGKISEVLGGRAAFIAYTLLFSAGSILCALARISITTVVLHTISDVHRAFYLVLFASALIMLISIPAIFIMPASPNVSTSRDQLAKLTSH